MSSFDGVMLDADGHLDMDQFPDDGSDLDVEALTALRGALHDDPVEEPSAEEFTGLVDGVMSSADDDGPFDTGDTGLLGEAAAAETDPADGDPSAADETAADEPDDDANDGDGEDTEGLVAEAAEVEAGADGFDGLADRFDDFDIDLGAVEDEALALDDGAGDAPAEITDIDDLL